MQVREDVRTCTYGVVGNGNLFMSSFKIPAFIFVVVIIIIFQKRVDKERTC